mgnify:CR=1 FL=1
MTLREVHVPDLGNFAEVPVIDVLVKVGDVVEADLASRKCVELCCRHVLG